MLERFFNRKKEEKESFESVDPVVEERRKQKFSRPLIYDDNEMEVEEEIKVETKKTPEPVKKSTVTETTYQMSEIISPMTGVQKSKKTEVKTVQKPKIKKIKKQNDELIPIISPFYGPAEEKKQESKPKPEVKKQEATLQSTKQTLNSQKQEQASLQKKFVAKLTQQNQTLASHTSEMSKNQESIDVIQKNLIAIQKASDASKVSNVTQATPNKKPSKPKPSNDDNSSKNEESTSSKDETPSSNDKEDNTTNKPDSSQDESQNENISSNEELGLAIANKALSRQGYMYVWDGGHSWSSIKDPNWTQFDCSGLVNWAHYQAGAPLSRIHYTGSLVSAGKSISRSELQAGDIILFSSNGKTSGVHHVGIYIGNNQMVHAPSTGKPVQVANLSYSYWQNEWFSTRRLY